MEARKIRSEADARRGLAAVEASGCPRVDWAREHGIDARSLHAWHVNLARGRRDKGPRRPIAPTQGLRLVELVANNQSVAAAYRIRCGVFEIEVVGDIEEERLGRLLRVMASSC